MKNLAFALLTTTVFVGAAQAADMPAVSAPIQAEVSGHDWSGFYVGAHVGYGWGSSDTVLFTDGADFPGLFAGEEVLREGAVDPGEDAELVAADVLAALALGGDFDAIDGSEDDLEGFLGGAQIGFNFQSGSFVFGVEGDFSATDLSSDSSFEVTTPGFDPFLLTAGDAAVSGETSADIDWLSTVRGRVGYAFDNVLVFASGGAAIAEVALAGRVTAFMVDGLGETLETTTSYDESDIRLGWTVGGGAEMAISENWSVKAEYQYVDLGEETIDLSDDSDSDVDINLHIVKAGLNYHF